MLKLYKVNPMVRAIGTMGAVAALVGGLTFALTPDQVALTNDQLTAASASLAIGVGTTGCVGTAPSQTGMSVTNLVPGGAASTPFDFCITNTGSVAQSVAMNTPTTFTGSTIPPADVTLDVTCGTTTVSNVSLATLESTPSVVETSLAAGATDQCNITASLTSAYTGNGGSITPFELDFTGTTITT